MKLKAPFPWFGGKSKAAPLVWSLLGDPDHYVEPFYGSGAVLLNRPHPCNRAYVSETVNDKDGFVVNFWRSVQLHPNETAEAASWPVSEADKVARQLAVLRWRSEHELEHLMGDPLWCDPLIAGWWAWAVSVQIGAFTGNGPWMVDPATGRVFKAPRRRSGDGVSRGTPRLTNAGSGVTSQVLREPGVVRQRPDVSNDGKGVNSPQLREPGVSRDIPQIGNDGKGVNGPLLREPGVWRQMPHLSDNGQGVNNGGLREPGVSRDIPHLSNNGRGVNSGVREPGVSNDDIEFHPLTMPKLRAWFELLQARLRHVRIVNGDWSRVCTLGAIRTLSVRKPGGIAGVFLDPPYSHDVREDGLYVVESGTVAADVQAWCIEHGQRDDLRIVLAGFDVEHEVLQEHGWTVHEWYKAGWLTGGMANTNRSGRKNQQHRERLWASPSCLRAASFAGR